MSAKQWTPEPWACHSFEEDGSYIYGNEHYPIAHTHTGKGLDWIGPNPLGAEGAKANASRIVACVNACEGLSDPEKEISELKEQRNALLAVMKSLWKHVCPVQETNREKWLLWSEVRDLIARIERKEGL